MTIPRITIEHINEEIAVVSRVKNDLRGLVERVSGLGLEVVFAMDTGEGEGTSAPIPVSRDRLVGSCSEVEECLKIANQMLGEAFLKKYKSPKGKQAVTDLQKEIEELTQQKSTLEEALQRFGQGEGFGELVVEAPSVNALEEEKVKAQAEEMVVEAPSGSVTQEEKLKAQVEKMVVEASSEGATEKEKGEIQSIIEETRRSFEAFNKDHSLAQGLSEQIQKNEPRLAEMVLRLPGTDFFRGALYKALEEMDTWKKEAEGAVVAAKRESKELANLQGRIEKLKEEMPIEGVPQLPSVPEPPFEKELRKLKLQGVPEEIAKPQAAAIVAQAISSQQEHPAETSTRSIVAQAGAPLKGLTATQLAGVALTVGGGWKAVSRAVVGVAAGYAESSPGFIGTSAGVLGGLYNTGVVTLLLGTAVGGALLSRVSSWDWKQKVAAVAVGIPVACLLAPLSGMSALTAGGAAALAAGELSGQKGRAVAGRVFEGVVKKARGSGIGKKIFGKKLERVIE